MSNNKKAFRSGIWYTASNFLVKSIGFITTPIFTRILTKTEFGVYNNYLSWLGIVTIFATLNLQATLISARYDFKEKFDEYILSLLALNTVSVGSWLIVFNVFGNITTSLFGLSRSYINAMMIYLLFLPAIEFFQCREQYYFEYKKTVVTSLVLALSTAVLSVILVINMENGLNGRVLGSIIPTVLMGAIFFCYFIKKGKRIKLSYWKYAIPICLPYIPHLLAGTLLNTTDRIMINRWVGDEATALYSLAYNCGAIVYLLLTSLNSAYAPWLGEKLAENNTQEIRWFSKIYICCFLFLAIGIMLISPELLLILGGESYLEAIYVLAPVSMGCICQFLYTLFVNVEQFKKKTVGMAIASILAALVNLGLNYFFIPSVGFLAAAYTTLVGYLCLLGIHMFLVWKLKLSTIYSYRFVGLTVIIGIISMILITLSYSNNIVRYIAIGIYCLIAIILILRFKDKLLSILKRKKKV